MILVEEQLFSSFPERDLSRSLPASSVTPFLRSPDQSVAKRGLQTSRVPANSPAQPIWCGRKEESVAQAQAARYVEQERNYYRRVTYSDVLPLVESSHILHHAHRRLGTMGWPQERFPYYANASTLPAPSAAPRPASSPRLVPSIGG